MRLSSSTFLIAATMSLNIASTGDILAEAVIKRNEVRIIDRVYQILDNDLLKVEFSEGSSNLTDKSMAAIADFVRSTKDEAKVDRYIVAAWAEFSVTTDAAPSP